MVAADDEFSPLLAEEGHSHAPPTKSAAGGRLKHDPSAEAESFSRQRGDRGHVCCYAVHRSDSDPRTSFHLFDPLARTYRPAEDRRDVAQWCDVVRRWLRPDFDFRLFDPRKRDGRMASFAVFPSHMVWAWGGRALSRPGAPGVAALFATSTTRTWSENDEPPRADPVRKGGPRA